MERPFGNTLCPICFEVDALVTGGFNVFLQNDVQNTFDWKKIKARVVHAEPSFVTPYCRGKCLHCVYLYFLIKICPFIFEEVEF